MKIYNVMKVPQGLGYDEVDYDALYQSGYTAGHQSGYTDGLNACFSVYPLFIEDNEGSGGTYTIDIVTSGIWTASWDGMIPGSDWCTFSPSSGEGSGQITLTLQPYENPEGSYELTRMGDLTITNSNGQSAVVQVSQRPEAPVATALTWQTEDECFGIIYNLFSLENGQTIHTDVVPSPSGVSTNLVFTSTNSAITIDSNGNITRSGGTNFDEIEISVTDTISNITLSGSVFCEAVPYIFVLQPNDCPCEGVDYFNDCSCVPASGGTYHNQLAFEAPWYYNLTSVQLSSKPSWVTVNPSAWTICEPGNLTFTVEPCNEYASGTDTYRDGWVEFVGNDVSGLTGGFYIKQNKPEPPAA